MNQQFSGVGTALVTPFDPNGNVDYPALKKLIDFNLENGVNYLVVMGTTAENATVSAAEKTAILAFVKQNKPADVALVYGLGGNNTFEVLQTIAETDFTGVDAILSVCPYYNKPSQAGIIAHFEAIAGASPVPVIAYNVPGRTVVNMQPATILALAAHPNIVGLKDACSSLEHYMEVAKNAPKNFLLIAGDDNLVTPMISIGWHGVISVISNAFPKEMATMTHAALQGDFKTAAQIQFSFLEFDTLLYAESNPVGIKKCLEIKGICGSDVRLPLIKASDDLAQKLQNAMRTEGFL